jgi:DNA polymerase III epsilon subunit-like protein
MKEITIDTETGGLDPLKHALLQIGGYDPTTNSRFSVYIQKPHNLEVTPGAQKVNGWPQSHAGKTTLPELEAIQLFLGWVKMTHAERLVAHNAPFDASFLKVSLSRNNVDPSTLPRFGCTQEQATQLNKIGGLPVTSLSLDSILKDLAPDYQRPPIHDASDDAYACYLARKAMDERFDKFAALANNAVMSSGPFSQTQRRGSRWGR